MAKKKAAPATAVVPKPTPKAVVFPELSEKNHIRCDTFLEDQVLLLNVCLSRCSPTLASKSNIIFQNVFTPAECRTFVDFIDSQPLELTPHKKRGEAVRVNCRLSSLLCLLVDPAKLFVITDRVSISSPEFAGRLWTVLRPHLPSFPCPSSVTPLATGARMAHSLNSNIRLYKYTPSQHFNPHYDDSVRDAKTGAVSEWTLLIYLTGVEDGVRGGEVCAYKSSKNFT